MKLTILGTGNAHAVDLYNTCFTLAECEEHFLVDAGGGNGILKQLRSAGIGLQQIHTMFVTHSHTDHILGAIWVIRMIGQLITDGKYTGTFYVYGNDVVIDYLEYSFRKLIRAKEQKLLGSRIFLVKVQDREEKVILGRKITFFDICSTKAKQFGFCMEYAEGKKLTCCGDEPYHPSCEALARGSEWLLHEAFCLYNERDIFKPYEKQHTTVKEVCELAEGLDIKKLMLYHTEETHGAQRKKLYTKEGQAFYTGQIFVPEDLEEFIL